MTCGMTTTTTLTISVTEQVFVANVMKVTMPIFQAHTDSLSRHTRVDDDLLSTLGTQRDEEEAQEGALIGHG